jgi:hypothetical protein
MAVEDQLVALLKADAAVVALAGARIYAMPAPQGTVSPFITYQMVNAQRTGGSYGGPAQTDVMTVQLDCWADHTTITNAQSRYRKVVDLARAVRAALHNQGLVGEDVVDRIAWTGWRDLNTPSETRRSLDFDLYVRDP